LKPPGAPHYGWPIHGPHTRLTSRATFAVVRWTNLYYPVERGWFGDWFGGPLRPLFGRGIVDRPVTGDLAIQRTPGLAHGRYFDNPDATGPNDMTTVLQETLALDLEDELVVAPLPSPPIRTTGPAAPQ
jgi:hypothetical protein